MASSDGPRIIELDAATVERIAAGEVIERPASAVKELWENSADAQSRNIVVELEAGGRRLIRVSDDGGGMSAEEAVLALKRHATSKIRALDDLERLATFGFRGEALPSIAAVSRLELLTRRPCDDAGIRLLAEAGRVVESAPAGCPAGTTVTVRNLFFNTPARLKSLRSQGAELATVAAVLQAAALARPDVAVRAAHEGRWLIAAPGSGRLAGAAAAVFGRLAQGFLPLGDEAAFPSPGAGGGYAVYGFLGRPELSRPTRAGQYFFVNRRPVKSATLAEAVESAYRTLLPQGRYPVVVVHLAAPAGAIDVNVHPAKAEIRFSDEDAAFAAVAEAARAALDRGGPLAVTPRPPMQRDRRPSFAADQAPRGPGHGPSRAPDRAPDRGPGRAPERVAEARPPYDPGVDIAALTPLGQVLGTYIVAAGPDGLYIIDQHAAHERITFERAAAEAGVASQQLLVPEAVDLDPSALPILDERRGLFQAIGFDWTRLGGNTVLLRAVPAICGGRGTSHFLSAVDRARDSRRGVDERLEAALILASCHAAVKAKDALDEAEMRRLLSDLAATARPHTCPHGRPTVAHLRRRDLERLFRRA